jgi:IS30 family transposase
MRSDRRSARDGRPLGAVARQLGGAKSTISWELVRNTLASGGFSPLENLQKGQNNARN